MRLERTASASRAHRGHYARLPQYQNVEEYLRSLAWWNHRPEQNRGGGFYDASCHM